VMLTCAAGPVCCNIWFGPFFPFFRHSSPIPTTGGRGGKCRTGSRAGVLRDSWPAGGCEARRSRRPGPMIVKTVNFLSRKRLRRNRARIVGESDRKPESAQSRASASE